MGKKFAERVFLIASIWGTLALAPLYFLEDYLGDEFPPSITHPEYFYGFVGVALAWQILFFIMSRNILQYRAVMIPALLEKLSFSLAVIVLYAQGRVASTLLGSAGLDLVFAGLFLVAYLKTDPKRLA